MPMSFALSDPAAEEPVESVGALSDSERLLLWGIRVWVGWRRQGMPPCRNFERMFAERDARAAAHWLGELLALIAWAPARPVDVRCPGCESLSRDEMRFLAAVACLQRGEPAVTCPLRALIDPSLALIGTEIAGRLAAALHDALYTLPSRRWPILDDHHAGEAMTATATIH